MKNLAILITIICVTISFAQAQETETPNFPEDVKGKNVSYVGHAQGSFKQITNKKWGEYDINDNEVSSFEEKNRDEWSVYLIDNSSNNRQIALNLWTKQINLNGSLLYNITKTRKATLTHGTPTTVTIKNCSDHNMTLYRGSIEGGTKIVELIAGSGNSPDSKWVGETRLGEIFSFKVDKATFYSKNFTVTEDNMKYCALAQEIYGSSKGPKRISNAGASRHGYDLLKIDPIYISYGKSDHIKDNNGNEVGNGGQRDQIFDDLNRQDFDWFEGDGGIALKNHFVGKTITAGRGNFSRKMYSSKWGFQQGISANIEVSGGASKGKKGKDGKKKASGSASFNHTYTKDENSGSVYIVNSKSHEWYSISLKPDYIDFARSFVEDVVALNKSNARQEDYKGFIEKYGTHYPTRTVYGAKFMSTERFSYEDLSEATSWGVDVGVTVGGSVPLPKDPTTTVNGQGKVGVGYSRSEQYTAMEQSNTAMYQYVGGAKGEGDWNVAEDNAMPIDITLDRISNLIDRKYFPYYPDVNFEQIQYHLENAITAYIGSPDDKGVSKKPRLFKFSQVKVKNIEWFNDLQLYGNFGISGTVAGTEKLYWYVKDNIEHWETDKFLNTGKHDRAIVEMPYRNDDEDLGQKTFVFELPENNKISLGGSLYRWHNMGRTDGENEEGDKVGTVVKSVDLSDVINAGTKEVTLTYDKIGKAEVIVTIEPVLFNFRD